MSSIRFANVLLEDKPRAFKYPTMYYVADCPFSTDRKTGEWTAQGPGTVDFTTYFNALSVMKLKRYSRATGFHLHLEIKGAGCDIIQTKACRLSAEPGDVAEAKASVPESDDWQSVDLALTVNDDMVLVGFRIETTGEVSVRNGYYTLDIDGPLNDVELSIATTTFRKEQFITRNIEMVRNELLDSEHDIAKHLHMHVIDNGSTLPADELSDGRITVSPNENVGGAGGFARGMIESMEQDVPATHVLLMDDDVEISPESILRTYNLLRIIRPEYREAFIAGAMLNIEDTQDMKEDTGFIDPNRGICVAAKPPLQVTKFLDIVYNECYDEEISVPKEAKRYDAWWYCCIPMTVIKREGLPLPVFVRYDDVEYGIRCNPTIMTMNGLAVWHAKFEIRYNATVERYQSIRNGMIAQATTGLAPSMDTFLNELRENINLELKKFNYTDAELALDGFEDFLKGPRFIEQPVAQEAFMRAGRNKEKLVSFDELQRQAEEMGIEGFDPYKLTRQIVDFDTPRTLAQRAFDFLTCNGQRFHSSKDSAKDYVVIPSAGWVYPAGRIHGENIIIGIDWSSQKGVIRVKDVKRYKAVMARYKRDLAYYKKNAKRLDREYKEAAPKLRSVDYWKQYLGMD